MGDAIIEMCTKDGHRIVNKCRGNGKRTYHALKSLEHIYKMSVGETIGFAHPGDFILLRRIDPDHDNEHHKKEILKLIEQIEHGKTDLDDLDGTLQVIKCHVSYIE